MTHWYYYPILIDQRQLIFKENNCKPNLLEYYAKNISTVLEKDICVMGFYHLLTYNMNHMAL